jgi:hypothetical protein
MTDLIAAVSAGVPTALSALRRLGRTLNRRASNVLTHDISRSLLETGGFRRLLHPQLDEPDRAAADPRVRGPAGGTY